MSRFTVAKALKGDPITFISKYDAAIDWGKLTDLDGKPLSPERFDSNEM